MPSSQNPQLVRQEIVGSASPSGESVPITSSDSSAPVMLDAGTGDGGSVRRVWVYGINIEAGVRHKAFIMFGDVARIVPCNVLPDIGIQMLVPGLPLQDDKAVQAYADVNTSKIELFTVRAPA